MGCPPVLGPICLEPHRLPPIPCSSYRFIFPSVYILFCLVDLLLFQLEDNLEEVSHSNYHLPGSLLRLDPKEAVAILGTAVDVTKCTVVRHVLGDEADLVHRVVVEAILQPVYNGNFITLVGLESIKTKSIKNVFLTPVFSSLILRPSTAI